MWNKSHLTDLGDKTGVKYMPSIQPTWFDSHTTWAPIITGHSLGGPSPPAQLGMALELTDTIPPEYVTRSLLAKNCRYSVWKIFLCIK